MLAGFDRYLQIARCFRDEDLRADRQPEFTQIDLEMSFIDEDDIMSMAEGFMKTVYKEVLDVDIQTPFPRMPYAEGMERFGSDKPDLRFGYELKDLTDVLKNTEFRVFAGAIAAGGCVRGINVKGGAAYTRKEIDKLAEWVKSYGAKGLAWTKLNPDGTSSSSYEKFLKEEEAAGVRSALEAENGDLLFIVASDKGQVCSIPWGPCGASAPSAWALSTKASPACCGSPTSHCLNMTRKKTGMWPSTIPLPTPTTRI